LICFRFGLLRDNWLNNLWKLWCVDLSWHFSLDSWFCLDNWSFDNFRNDYVDFCVVVVVHHFLFSTRHLATSENYAKSSDSNKLFHFLGGLKRIKKVFAENCSDSSLF